MGGKDMKEKGNLILTLAGIGVSNLGSSLYAFAISFYILSMTGSSNSFAISLMISVLPKVLLSPIAGNLVDRMNKKYIVVLSDIISGGLMFILLLLTKDRSLSLGMIYTVSLLLSILNVLFRTAFSASYGSIVTKKYITKLNSYEQTVQAIIQIGAPILGGITYALVDMRLFILINGVSFVISGLTEMGIDFKYNSKKSSVNTNKNSFLLDFIEGYRYLKREKIFFAMAIYALVINFFLSSFSVIMPYTLITIHGFESNMVGYLEAAFPVGMLIMSVIVGQLNMTFSKQLLGKTILLFALCLFLFSIPSLPMISFGKWTPIYYGFTFAFMSANAIAVNVPLGVAFQTKVEEEYRGRFFGFLNMITQGVMPLSYLLTGFLIGILPTYVIIDISCVALIGVYLHITHNQALDEEKDTKKVILNVGCERE